MRLPNRCVLQAASGAVSVSWFPGTVADVGLGELQVIVWRGIVSPGGSAAPPREGATIVSEMEVRPVEPVGEECIWQDSSGKRYDSAELAAKCLALLEEQIRAEG